MKSYDVCLWQRKYEIIETEVNKLSATNMQPVAEISTIIVMHISYF